MMFVCMFCGTSSHPFEQNEVCIYSMNKISFDRIVRGMPEKFWYVTLPEPHQEVVPETGNLSSNPFLKSHNTFVCVTDSTMLLCPTLLMIFKVITQKLQHVHLMKSLTNLLLPLCSPVME